LWTNKSEIKAAHVFLRSSRRDDRVVSPFKAPLGKPLGNTKLKIWTVWNKLTFIDLQ